MEWFYESWPVFLLHPELGWSPYIFDNESRLMTHVISLIPRGIGFLNKTMYWHKNGFGRKISNYKTIEFFGLQNYKTISWNKRIFLEEFVCGATRLLSHKAHKYSLKAQSLMGKIFHWAPRLAQFTKPTHKKAKILNGQDWSCGELKEEKD